MARALPSHGRGHWFESSIAHQHIPWHNGVDIKGDTGDPVVAVLDGEVLSARNCPSCGNTVVVYHGAGLSTVYAHLDSLAVAVADEVDSGQLLGAMGTTGRSTGLHLDFETRVDSRAVDPEPFMP